MKPASMVAAWLAAGELPKGWTAGCVAVDDDEIVEVASLVKDGTEVDIDD